MGASAQVSAGVARPTAAVMHERFARRRQQLLAGALVGLDLVIITATCVLAIWLRTQVTVFGRTDDVFNIVGRVAIVEVVLWLGCLFAAGAHRVRILGAGAMEYRAVFAGSMAAAAATGIAAYLFDYPLSRAFYFFSFLLGTLGLLLGRFWARRLLHWLRNRDVVVTPVLVAGDPSRVAHLSEIFEREKWVGYRPVAVLTHDPMATSVAGLPVMGRPDDVLDALNQTHAQAVIFLEGSFKRAHHFNELARRVERAHASLIVIPSLTEISSNRVEMQTVAGVPLLTVAKPQAVRASKGAKRIFDVVAAAALLVLLAPLMLVAMLAVKLEDGGPVLFRQPRVGKDGAGFNCLKFRSMVVDAEKLKTTLAPDGANHVMFKLKNDPRITRVGRWTRRFSIDELPQLWNVLRGDMSLVGPRPALPTEVSRYKSHVLRRLDVRPGITGLWQVSGRSDLSWDDSVRLDLYYVDNWSFIQDLTILFRTVRAVFSSTGAY